MNVESIYALARNAGFPPDTAVKMTAIAMRESSGNPNAYNGTPPDDSYGLWQINMLGNLGIARRRQFGISSNAELFDPAVNARAAYLIWNGSEANLKSAWYIDRPVYRERYEQFLPAAQRAANLIEGGASPGILDPSQGPMKGEHRTLEATSQTGLTPVRRHPRMIRTG